MKVDLSTTFHSMISHLVLDISASSSSFKVIFSSKSLTAVNNDEHLLVAPCGDPPQDL